VKRGERLAPAEVDEEFKFDGDALDNDYKKKIVITNSASF